MSKQYKTATAFRTALEARIKQTASSENIDIQKLRRQVAFDRLLFRFFQNNSNQFYLKGGYSMELRIQKARSTKDIDLVLKSTKDGNSSKSDIHELILEASQTQTNDFFEFFIHEPTLELEAIPYGGFRFPVEAHVDNRLFVRFPIDIVISSLVLDPIENLDHKDWLEFAGIKSPHYPTISKEQQFAEKLHAYTFPRTDEENSRVKDVIDLYLLIETGTMNPDYLKHALQEVFNYRGTHSVPEEIQDPPQHWAPQYTKLANECEIDKTLDEVLFEIRKFLKQLEIEKLRHEETIAYNEVIQDLKEKRKI